jgi:hypothetical protein
VSIDTLGQVSVTIVVAPPVDLLVEGTSSHSGSGPIKGICQDGMAGEETLKKSSSSRLWGLAAESERWCCSNRGSGRVVLGLLAALGAFFSSTRRSALDHGEDISQAQASALLLTAIRALLISRQPTPVVASTFMEWHGSMWTRCGPTDLLRPLYEDAEDEIPDRL